jgi:L-lactate dehydrogenase
MADKTKISVIGCGRVGITAAYTMYIKNKAHKIILYDRNKERIRAERLDFLHGLPFLGVTTINVAEDLKDVEGSDIIIYTTGVSQNPGETRLDLVKRNTEVLETMFPRLVEYSPDSIFIIVANPVDVLTYKAYKMFNLPRGKILATGTTLDTARFRFYLSEFLHVNPISIHGYILGEHGDSSFPTISTTSIGGQPILSIKGVTEEMVMAAYKKARNAAYEVIAGKGATYYSIGVVINEIVEAILNDSKKVYPVSVPLMGEYGYSDVSLSVPCVIGRNGVERIVETHLSDKEKIMMDNSVKTIKSYLG